MTTLKGILENKYTSKAAKKECGIHSQKGSTIQTEKFNQIEKALEQWLEEAHACNMPVIY